VTYLAATAIAKAEFERYLEQIGVTASWQARTSNVPDSGGDISETTGRADPVDNGYTDEFEDTDIYAAGVDILVAKDAPLKQATVAQAVALSEGGSVAHCSADHAVGVGDLLVIGGEAWYVEGATLAQPPIWRELTLKLRRK
jgi:hypothetical protein